MIRLQTTLSKRLAQIGACLFLLAGAGGSRTAFASLPSMNWKGGAIKNLTIDVVFMGPFTSDDRNAVINYIVTFCDFLGGGPTNPPGSEAAVHYYGVSNCVPDLDQCPGQDLR